MAIAPVLLIAFNRPDRLKRLIESLRAQQPPTIRIVIDGPRPMNQHDVEATEQSALVCQEIDWTTDVVIHRHSANLGIRRAIPWAISWALEEFESVIIIEDDVTVGPQFLDFASRSLSLWKSTNDVYAISGYCAVPADVLADPESPARFSHLSHSYAWATWRRAWRHFDREMQWFRSQNLSSLRETTGSMIEALRWRQFSRYVAKRQVDTWDYQWVTSIWAHGGRTIMPNRNLVVYHGAQSGTHTFRRPKFEEQSVSQIDLDALHSISHEIDKEADRFTQKYVNRCSLFEVILGPLESLGLSTRVRWRNRKKPQK